MRAQILTAIAPIETRPLREVELPAPEPGPHEVRLRVTVCGACHTELDEIEGRLLPRLPIIPGHQVVGLVDKVGSAVTTLRVGDRIGVAWIYSACGACSFCRSERENLCPDAAWTGKDVPGGYAEAMVVPAGFAYPLPARLSDAQAAPLLCAGVIGYRALRLTGLQDGETLALYGFGASAHLVIQVVKHLYPTTRLLVFTRGEAHRRLALQLGADWTGAAADPPPQPPERAIDFTPAGEVVRAALAHLQRGGRLVINAIRKATPVPHLDYGLHLWDDKEVKSVANVTRRDALEFLGLAARIPVAPAVEEFPLAEANEALVRLKDGRIRGAAVLRVSH